MFEKYKLFIKKLSLYLLVLIPLVGFLYYSVMISKSIECSNGEVIHVPKGASLSYVVNEVKKCECFPNPSFLKYAVILTNKNLLYELEMNAQKLSRPNATQNIIKEIEEIVKND